MSVEQGGGAARARGSGPRAVLAAILVGFALGVAVVSTPASRAHFSTSGQFSHDTDACTSSTNRKDPVMNVFYSNATPSNTGTHIQHHTGWTNQEGGPQNYKVHADPTVCQWNAETSQRASSCGSCARTHIRFKLTWHGDATWGTTSLGTPHNEDHVFCGHAVYDPWGFQDGRTMIYNNVVATGGHGFAGAVYWGNTAEPKPQCNGWQPNSIDGKVDYINMP